MSFKKDVCEGLSAKQKKLSSKYFYDAYGDKLFQRIMKLPEYYLTNCEIEIFENQSSQILEVFNEDLNKFDLIEFGAGDGTKTKILVSELLQSGADFRYIPIDISNDVLEDLSNRFKESFPKLEIAKINSTYFEALDQLNNESNRSKLILFLGSSIGNFSNQDAIEFLKQLHKKLNPGDQALIGFDLKKNPHTILKAYNDSQGVTKEFNINLLRRLNNELGANFDLDSFDHYPFYDPETGLAKSYLVSLKDQEVKIEECQLKVPFRKGESIHTEISKKYDREEIEHLVHEAGFMFIQHFMDSKKYYTNTLIQAQ